MNEKFWAIWRKTGGGPPQKRHETEALAIAEANRLVKQTGEEYYVLEVIGIVRPTYAPTEYVEV